MVRSPAFFSVPITFWRPLKRPATSFTPLASTPMSAAILAWSCFAWVSLKPPWAPTTSPVMAPMTFCRPRRARDYALPGGRAACFCGAFLRGAGFPRDHGTAAHAPGLNPAPGRVRRWLIVRSNMDAPFLGMAGVDGWLLLGLSAASFVTTFLSVALAMGGGLMLLAILAMFFPPAVLIPIHTLVQLGVGAGRIFLMWRYILWNTLLPFTMGAALGAFAGAQIFITLPAALLYGGLSVFIVTVTWLPALGRFGPERGRFALLGLGATFLGMFVSATGTLVSPFVAAASPDRRNHSATLAVLMTVVHIMKIAAFGALGVGIGAYLPLVAAMIATAAAGSWLGRAVLNRMEESWYRIAFKVVMTVLSVRLMWVALGEAGVF
ncbi:MAG: sulfite exporter TauE/SafE family protein [Alphaproteobacteria bacterium]|nr:MAG: sulfite exporter TauE/SafE family protein [Alphaproteobacteria bacterium]